MSGSDQHFWLPQSISRKIASWVARRKLYQERFAVADARCAHLQLRYDPIEDDPSLQDAFKQADALVRDALVNRDQGHGRCHLMWNMRQRVLRERFGVEWFTPREMNPDIRFD